MMTEEIYDWDLTATAREVFGTNDERHPLVAEMHRWGKRNISGHLQYFAFRTHYDFRELRLTRRNTQPSRKRRDFDNVVAFQTRNPLHRAHEELTKRAVEDVNGVLLLHPVVGMTKPGDIDYFTRVRTYKALASKYYDEKRIVLSLLPLAMRIAGPREALWHALDTAKLRREPHDHRTRSRESGKRLHRQAVLFAVRGTGAGPKS
jgi:sulfate adenylyltransferase